MNKTILALAALTLMALVSATSAFADGPSPSSSPRHRPAEYSFLLEVGGITPDQKTIIGGFKSMSGMDSGSIVLEHSFTSTDPLPPGLKKAMQECAMDGLSGSVIILDQDLETEVARHNFYEAWHCKWYVPDLESDSSGMAIGKLEIAFDKVERVVK